MLHRCVNGGSGAGHTGNDLLRLFLAASNSTVNAEVWSCLSAVSMKGSTLLSTPTSWSTLQAPAPSYLQVRLQLAPQHQMHQISIRQHQMFTYWKMFACLFNSSLVRDRAQQTLILEGICFAPEYSYNLISICSFCDR